MARLKKPLTEWLVEVFGTVILNEGPDFSQLDAVKISLADIWKSEIPNVDTLLDETERHYAAEWRAAHGRHRWEVGEQLIVVGNRTHDVKHFLEIGEHVRVREQLDEYQLGNGDVYHGRCYYVAGSLQQTLAEEDLKLAPREPSS